MKDRKEQLIEIRPILDLIKATTETEQFQNNTLRPILKFQNPLILEVFRNFIEKRFRKKKNTFSGMDISDQNAFINNTLKTDVSLKNIFLGIVLGHFTVEELAFYYKNKGEINRRITTLLIQRLQSQVEKFV
ncbi:MAG: glyoxalase [Saprospiraceae bacterium]